MPGILKKDIKQSIIKYLGIESDVSLSDIPENFRDSEKIITYFRNQKYFQPTVQNEITKKLQMIYFLHSKMVIMLKHILYLNHMKKFMDLNHFLLMF